MTPNAINYEKRRGDKDDDNFSSHPKGPTMLESQKRQLIVPISPSLDIMKMTPNRLEYGTVGQESNETTNANKYMSV